MAEVKEAKRVVSLEDIKFNKDNATMAVVACLIGPIIFFTEKKDLFVRYYAAQYGILTVVSILGSIVLGIIPVVNFIFACVSPILGIGLTILVVLGAVKAYKGERYDVPMISKYALELMSKY